MGKKGKPKTIVGEWHTGEEGLPPEKRGYGWRKKLRELLLCKLHEMLHKSLRHVRLSPMGQGASMRNDAESIHVPVPSTQLVRLQSGAGRQGASDLLVR